MIAIHAGHVQNEALNRDPTQTTTLRQRFERDLSRRIRRVKGLIRATVGYENDAFGLSANQTVHEHIQGPTDSTPPSLITNRYIDELWTYVRDEIRDDVWHRVSINRDLYDQFHNQFGSGLIANAEPADTFDFPTDSRKQRAFHRWLKRALADEFLEPATFVDVREGRHYTATYVRSSYSKAVEDAGRRLRAEGFDVPDEAVSTIFNLPVHESSLRRIYTRAYENLEGINDDAAQVIRQELAQGFAEGVNPREMATRMNRELDTIDLKRARVLARTEVIHSYSTGTLDRYERAGVGRVTVSAEFASAADDRVCSLCASQEGRVHSVSEARTGTFDFAPGEQDPPSLEGTYPVNPPIHPSCRCSWLPVVS